MAYFSQILLNRCVLTACSAHIRGSRHKKKVASVRKQAARLSAAEAEADRTTDGRTDALADGRVDDSTDQAV